MTFAGFLGFLVLFLACLQSKAAEPVSQSGFFLPQNPVAAAYVLGRLSNRELTEAPRSEFVYVALLERNGLERKYRIEALNGLMAIHHTSQLEELLHAVNDLDQKGKESEGPLSDLAGILLQSSRSELESKRSELNALAIQGRLSPARQIGWASRMVIEPAIEPVWLTAESNPLQLQDLVRSIPMLPNSVDREGFYPRLKQLLLPGGPPDLVRAAAQAIVTLTGHDTETFGALAALVQADVQAPAAIEGLLRIPRSAWPKENLEPLSQSLLQHLQMVVPEHRAEAVFAEALQFATEVASLLPPAEERAMANTLRNLGPTVVTLHAVYEQMRFDKDRIVVEPGKPTVIFLQNDDAMPHNLAILAPGALQEIGLAAEKMPPQPDSEGRLYVPSSSKVLHAIGLVSPGQKLQLAFNAPNEPGDYPFTCTFPGHWLRMSGTLTVVPDAEAYLASHPLSQQPQLTEWKLADFAMEMSHTMEHNAAAGKELFSKLACVQCHKVGNQGYTYGPDLTEVFKRYKNDSASVLQQILEPSKVIEDRYLNFNFDLRDGDSLIGMVLKEDDQNVTIQTGPADSLIQVLKKIEIQRRQPRKASPMPVGLLNSLSKTQIFDLLAYLESGGNVPVHAHAH
jgi:putative heme-binding domain-containing protein